MSDLKCHCGYYHYNFQHWSKIHGESEKLIDPYVQIPFVGDEIWDESKHNQSEPYPLISKKWICQFCAFFSIKGHDKDCSYFLNKKITQ